MTVQQAEFERLVHQLRSTVSDPRAGIFAPEGAFWAVSRETMIALGGGRAVLLQLAHPFVAHGVDQHSAARVDPVGRFLRTFERVFDVIFGDLDTAIDAARRVHAVHGQVRGVVPEAIGDLDAGSTYEANDEGALFWVHATLLDSALRVFDRVVRPLSAAEKETYYQESKRFAQLFGVAEEHMPADYPAFERYNETMWASERLTVSREARDIAHFLLDPPRPVIAPLWRWYVRMTVGLLPPRIREQYGFTFSDADQRAFDRWLRRLHVLHAVIPRRLRWMPGYFSAIRRLRGKAGPDWLDRLVRRALRASRR